MKNIFAIILCISSFLVISCSKETQENQDNIEQEIAPDSIDTEGISEAEKRELDCLTHSDYICETGLFFVRIGDYIADIQAEEVDGATISDSLVSENGYEWVVRTMELPEGQIIVEGEFVDERKSNDTILSNTRVNRVRVETPLFQTADQIKVGDSITKLLEVYTEESFQVVSIPSYEIISVQVSNQKLNYLVKDDGNALANSLPGDVINIDDLPREALISGIVVM
jgi:hypothetical protein